MAPIAGLGVEVWTTNAGFHFDNFVVGHSLPDAFTFADETFTPKQTAEREQDKKDQDEIKKQAREEKLREGGLVNTLSVYVAEAFDFIASQPPGALIVGVLLVLATIYFFLPTPTPAVSEAVENAEPVTEEKENSQSAPASETQNAPSSPIVEEPTEPEAEKVTPKRRSRKTD